MLLAVGTGEGAAAIASQWTTEKVTGLSPNDDDEDTGGATDRMKGRNGPLKWTKRALKAQRTDGAIGRESAYRLNLYFPGPSVVLFGSNLSISRETKISIRWKRELCRQWGRNTAIRSSAVSAAAAE